MARFDTYSVLMSVYSREKPQYLRQAIDSMFSQTICTDDFVLVCDGPLTDELDAVVEEAGKRCAPGYFRALRLERNQGLGNALNAGMNICRNELIARMDSDDISCADRCERQLRAFAGNPDLDIVSGTVEEFRETEQLVTGRRALPAAHEAICRFSRKRNPFNHPAVMFKKSAVEAAGGYDESYHLFEDYYLWIRMLRNGCRGENLQETLLYMRISEEMYERRGGASYGEDMKRFHRWMRDVKWASAGDYITGVIPHALICRLPNHVRRAAYTYLHR
ncbi:glycosyltransferase [Clostridiaceae bacterium]|jgi:glycosyltransferase involved in cell wall biosynthesis|nr:glycosyltransferase [Clostridium sp.]NBI72243.1 glycosyltransferase [Clostridiaceae bacterium]